MFSTLVRLFRKYQEPILYVFFGGLTTLVNLLAYYLLTRTIGIGELAATAAAWVLSVVFAYITNKIWVFRSRRWDFLYLCKEVASFFGCRLFSGALDVGIMYVFATLLGINDMLIKILSNVVVIILNYLFSKLLIFKKGQNQRDL